MVNPIKPLFFGILFVGFIVTFATAMSVYYRRKAVGAKVFSMFLFTASSWCLFYFFITIVEGSVWKIFLFNINYIFVIFVPILFLQFSMEFSGISSKKRILYHSILLLIFIGLLTIIWTDVYHGLAISDFEVMEINGISFLTFERGPLHYILDLTLLFLILIATVSFLRRMKEGSKEEKKHIIIVLLVLYIPIIGVMLEIFDIWFFGILDTAPFLFIISASIVSYGLIRMDLFYIRTMSRDMTVDNISEGIISIGSRGTVIDINQRARRLLGVTFTDLSHRSLNDLHPALASKVNELNEEKNESCEMVIGKKGRTFDVKCSAIFDRKGKNLGKLVLLQDVTKKKETEELLVEKDRQLKETNESLRVINKILRHDIMNDLMAINMARGVFKKTGNEDVLDKLDISVNRSISLIRRMKELESSMNEGKGLIPVDLAKTLNEEAKRNSIDITIKGNCTVQGDEALHSLFQNLISNAIKHGKADHIDVKIECNNNYCDIFIMDNGIGMRDAVKENAFEEGFSYGESKGSGLGLYIVNKTMNRYGGDVKIIRTGSEGTLFKLRFNSTNK